MNRVLPAQHEFVQRTLRDFRVVENGARWVARLKGEGRFRSSVFPEAGEPQVLVELIPEQEWRRPGLVSRWITALRLPYLTISLLPLLLVLCVARFEGPALLTALLLACVTLIHLGCNLWSDFEDHLRGVDSPGQSGGSGVIQRLWIPAVHLQRAAAALFLLGCLAGACLLWQLPHELVTQRLVWFGLVGALAAASYSGWPFHYKYFGLGEPIVFLLSGPFTTVGAAALFFPSGLGRFALLSLPLAFLVTLRLHAGNMQRIPFDTIARVVTIARWSGFGWSKLACVFLAYAPYLTVLVLVGAGLAGNYALAVFVTLPLALRATQQARAASGPLDPLCLELRRTTAALHFACGLVYALSFLA